MMYLCRTQGAMGWGIRMHKSPSEGWVTREPGVLPHTAPPTGGARPVPSGLSHGGQRGVGLRDPENWPLRLRQVSPQIAC